MKKYILVLLGFLCACSTGNKLELHLKFEKYVDLNFKDYSHIYQEIIMRIKELSNNRADGVKELLFTDDFNVDKLILVNEENTKLVGIITISNSHHKNSTHDWIFMFSGIKISNRWNFVRGGSLYVPRENYKYNVNEPLTHFQLSVIGRDFFLKKFLIVENDIKIDSDIVNKHVSLQGSHKYKDSNPVKNWIAYLEDKNSKIISDKEFNDIQESIKNEVHKDKVLPKKGTKEWTELYGTKTPLFERKEWKNLIKK